MRAQRIILCGFGKVGQAFAQLLQERRELLQTRYGLALDLVAVVDIGGAALAPRGLPIIPPAELLNHVKAGGSVQGFGDFGMPSATGDAVIDSVEADLVVEATPTNLTTGEPGLRHMRTALSRGMHVIAANKGPLVLRYGELQALAQKHGGQIYMSAATAAALPTLDVGQTCLAGAQILGIEGILNGTTNFILSKMQEEGSSYLAALQEAQARGITETDPTLDVEGFDTANKLILLSNALLGTGYGPNAVSRCGMTHLTPRMLMDARRAGRCVKLIGRASLSHGMVRLTVAPEEVPLNHPLASVNGAEKAVTYQTDTMGWVTVMGGQSSPTGAAAALLKDIINLSRVAAHRR
ncbi:MAG TPA: homoserine dehydrogenase [Candidatus Tectomicrobia bacterium]|nr:homoserine dehydrogenase [Candidatus Tectomicrobia bacterium]